MLLDPVRDGRSRRLGKCGRLRRIPAVLPDAQRQHGGVRHAGRSGGSQVVRGTGHRGALGGRRAYSHTVRVHVAEAGRRRDRHGHSDAVGPVDRGLRALVYVRADVSGHRDDRAAPDTAGTGLGSDSADALRAACAARGIASYRVGGCIAAQHRRGEGVARTGRRRDAAAAGVSFAPECTGRR